MEPMYLARLRSHRDEPLATLANRSAQRNIAKTRVSVPVNLPSRLPIAECRVRAPNNCDAGRHGPALSLI